MKKIPKGHVATYGRIAEMAGEPKMARAVGNALHKNPDPEHIPCFRVVNSKGELQEPLLLVVKMSRQEDLWRTELKWLTVKLT